MANPEDLGRYRLKRLLGRGALGEVWEANDLEMGSKVVVKIMHAADDELAMARTHFAREARLASLMRHPHVVAVHDAGEAAGTSFMVMELVEGKSLRTAITDPSITTQQKLRWLRQVGDGLSAMHRAGVVHRDLKPENVIIRADNTVCLVDLGIARWVKFDLGGRRDFDDAEDIEGSSATFNEETPPIQSAYRPPETGDDGQYDELSDQYAWGVLAYELLTGAPPSDVSPPITREDVPHSVCVAIERARSVDRDARWDGMELLLDELIDHAASKRPSEQTKAVEPPPPPTLPRPNANPDANANANANANAIAAADEVTAKAVEPTVSTEARVEKQEPPPRKMSPVALGVGVVVVLGIVVAIIASLR